MIIKKGQYIKVNYNHYNHVQITALEVLSSTENMSKIRLKKDKKYIVHKVLKFNNFHFSVVLKDEINSDYCIPVDEIIKGYKNKYLFNQRTLITEKKWKISYQSICNNF